MAGTVMPTSVRQAIKQLPRSPGVYRFRDARGTVLYVGRATELRPRVSSYWSKLRGRRHLARMVAQIDRIEAVGCDSVHEATWLERNLLERSKPRWNRTRGGQETPVYLRLDSRPGSPGLSVAHVRQEADGVEHFGPYLGGERARLTVSALHRILPLDRTGTRLRGAQLDIARARGADQLDAAVLTERIAAVLQRDPQAVAQARTDLEAARDRASAATAFELAGRVQEELVALDWTTGPQRVTVEPGPVEDRAVEDVDLYGWSEGLLVHLAVHAGRLDTWSQRRCGPERARLWLASTPPEWAGFAQRAADLAAALAGPEIVGQGLPAAGRLPAQSASESASTIGSGSRSTAIRPGSARE